MEIYASVVTMNRQPYILTLIRNNQIQKETQDRLIRISTAVEKASEGIGIIGQDCKLLYANAALYKLINLGKKVADECEFFQNIFPDPELRQEALRELKLNNSWKAVTEFRSKKGGLVSLDVHIDKIIEEPNVFLGWVLFVRDISEEIRQQENIARTNMLLDLTIQNAPVGIVTITPEGLFRSVNPFFLDLIGKKEKDVVGSPYFSIIDAISDNTLNLSYEVLSSGNPIHYEKEKSFIRNNNRQYYFNISSTVIRNSTGGEEFALAIIEDVTESVKYRKRESQFYNSISNLYNDLRQLSEVLEQKPDSDKPVPLEEYGITSREKAIMSAVKQGLKNKDIAGQLFISEHTVKKHLTSIFNKLNVTSRFELLSLIEKSNYDL